MTTVNCDGCGEKIGHRSTNTIEKLPVIRFKVPRYTDYPALEFVTASVHAGEGRQPASIELLANFNATDISICAACMLKAFKEAVAKL